jgi:hypothetical protein
MINYEELEDAALYGIEEDLNNCESKVLDENESGYMPDTNDGEYQGEEMAEAIYMKYMGWA